MNDAVNFAGNDYLGLASHPAVVRAFQEAAGRYGISATASRWSVGWTTPHEQLEQALAVFCGSQATCLLPAACLGSAIYYGRMAVAGYRVVFCDQMVHSSQHMGMRAAGLVVRPWRHLDVEDLRAQMAGYRGPPAIIATDGVYGISGEVAPLAELSRIAASIGAALFVDDAHGFGVLGSRGRGTVEACGVAAESVTILGSLSKALGTSGGFLAGAADLIEACRHSPESAGSTSSPIPIAAAALAGLDLLDREPSLRQGVHSNAARMRQILAAHDIRVVCDRHPIVSMLLADEREAAALSRHFLSFGIRIPWFQYASEPRHNLLRSVARAIHTREDLDRFEEAVHVWHRRHVKP